MIKAIIMRCGYVEDATLSSVLWMAFKPYETPLEALNALKDDLLIEYYKCIKNKNAIKGYKNLEPDWAFDLEQFDSFVRQVNISNLNDFYFEGNFWPYECFSKLQLIQQEETLFIPENAESIIVNLLTKKDLENKFDKIINDFDHKTKIKIKQGNPTFGHTSKAWFATF